MSVPTTSVPPTGLLIVSTCVGTEGVPTPRVLSGLLSVGGIGVPRPSVGFPETPAPRLSPGPDPRLLTDVVPPLPVAPPVGAGRMRTTARMTAAAATAAPAIHT